MPHQRSSASDQICYLLLRLASCPHTALAFAVS